MPKKYKKFTNNYNLNSDIDDNEIINSSSNNNLINYIKNKVKNDNNNIISDLENDAKCILENKIQEINEIKEVDANDVVDEIKEVDKNVNVNKVEEVEEVEEIEEVEEVEEVKNKLGTSNNNTLEIEIDDNKINHIIINDLSINKNYNIIKSFDELKALYENLNFIDKFNNTNYSKISKNLLELYHNPNSFIKLMNDTIDNFENNGNMQLFNNDEILNTTIQNIKLLYKPFIINQCYLYIYYYNILIPYIKEHLSIKLVRIIDLNIAQILLFKKEIEFLYEKQKNILSNYDIHINDIL